MRDKKRITVREIADIDSKISSTRWAFASTIIFDMTIIVIVIAVYIACHFLSKPLDISFFYAVVALLGVLTGITGTTKALQGFEPHNRDKDSTGEDEDSDICEPVL